MKIAIITKDSCEKTIYLFNKINDIVNKFSQDVVWLKCDNTIRCDTLSSHIDNVIFHDFIIIIGKQEADTSIRQRCAYVSNTFGDFIRFSTILEKMNNFQSEFIFS